MTTGTLDRRTILVLVMGVALVLVLRFVVMADKQPTVAAAIETTPQAEKRLAKLREIAATVPLGRFGTPADVAGVCMFLASPLSSYVSGAAVEAHGGGEWPAYLSALSGHRRDT